MIIDLVKKSVLMTMCIVLFSCGYNVVNKSINNLNILDISTTGEQKINYKIKNKILLNSSDSGKNSISLSINTTKKKIIKDKNINNEIVKYEIQITTNVTYSLLGQIKEGSFTLNEFGDYSVDKKRITSLNNEKKLTNRLTNDIIDKILIRLSKEINVN